MNYTEELKAQLSDFIEERIQVSNKKLISTEEYKIILKKYYNLFSKIEKLIDNQKLAECYKEAEYNVYTLQLKEAYKLGFYDGILIKNDNV